MTATPFGKTVVRAFPQLREDIIDADGVVHLEMFEFLAFTQKAIESRQFEVVRTCFQIATDALTNGDDELKNAVYVSYLEDLDFRTEAGRDAASLMSPELRQARYDILDYNKQLLGRKWAKDERPD